MCNFIIEFIYVSTSQKKSTISPVIRRHKKAILLYVSAVNTPIRIDMHIRKTVGQMSLLARHYNTRMYSTCLRASVYLLMILGFEERWTTFYVGGEEIVDGKSRTLRLDGTSTSASEKKRRTPSTLQCRSNRSFVYPSIYSFVSCSLSLHVSLYIISRLFIISCASVQSILFLMTYCLKRFVCIHLTVHPLCIPLPDNLFFQTRFPFQVRSFTCTQFLVPVVCISVIF